MRLPAFIGKSGDLLWKSCTTRYSKRALVGGFVSYVHDICLLLYLDIFAKV